MPGVCAAIALRFVPDAFITLFLPIADSCLIACKKKNKIGRKKKREKELIATQLASLSGAILDWSQRQMKDDVAECLPGL